MLKRSSLVLCALFMSLGLSGCQAQGVSNSAEIANESSTEDLDVVDNASLPSTASIEVDLNTESESNTISDNLTDSNILLDKKLIKKLKRYTTKYSTIHYSKSISTFSLLDGIKNDETLISKQSFKVDLANRVTLMSLRSRSDSLGDNTYYFADNNKKGIHTSKINKGKYILDKSLDPILRINYKKNTDSFDFIGYLMGGEFKLAKFKGYANDNVYTFVSESEVKKSDLKGIDYDDLGTSRLRLVLKDSGNDSLVPVSLSIENTFFVGQIEYGVSTDYTFTKFSDKSLEFPKYVQVKKLGKKQ